MHFVVPHEQAKTFFPEGVHIGKSKIPNAGDELFTTKEFKQGDLICEFPGFWVPTSAVTTGKWKGSLKPRGGNSKESMVVWQPHTTKGNRNATMKFLPK